MGSDRPLVLGISGSHNGSACLLRGDEIVAATSEERLTRRKRDRVYCADPALSIAYCLQAGGIEARDLARVVASPQKRGFRARHDPALNPLLRVGTHQIPCERIPHHYAHAVSVYATCGRDDAVVVVVDGIGSHHGDLSGAEQAAIVNPQPDAHEVISVYRAAGDRIDPVWKQVVEAETWIGEEQRLGRDAPGMPTFRSLGGMFSAVSVLLFGTPDEAGKVMGLAAYGEPTISWTDFFAVRDGVFTFHDLVPEAHRYAERWPKNERVYADLAASVQAALEVAMLAIVAEARRRYPTVDVLCLAGGVALNSLANQRLAAESGFDVVHVVPASDDSGAALGAAFHGLRSETGRLRGPRQESDALGASYTRADVDAAVARTPAVVASEPPSIAGTTAELLVDGQIVGWFHGRSEFGPRALGRRSILCDPRRPDMKEHLNARVKHREAFRPFAASVLADAVPDWFVLAGTNPWSPFMLRVFEVHEAQRARVPAVVHPDGTCRIQTLTPADGRIHDVVRAFYERTGVPMVLNTSLNVMGEPIVETPEDALWVLLYTGLDHLVLEDLVVTTGAGYEDVFSLVPQLTTTTVDVRYETGAWDQPVALSYRATTRWGPLDQTVGGEYAALLPLVDGRRTVGDVYAALAATGSPLARSREGFAGAVAELWRRSLVRVRPEADLEAGP
jgi:carbamoyltransferase